MYSFFSWIQCVFCFLLVFVLTITVFDCHKFLVYVLINTCLYLFVFILTVLFVFVFYIIYLWFYFCFGFLFCFSFGFFHWFFIVLSRIVLLFSLTIKRVCVCLRFYSLLLLLLDWTYACNRDVSNVSGIVYRLHRFSNYFSLYPLVSFIYYSPNAFVIYMYPDHCSIVVVCVFLSISCIKSNDRHFGDASCCMCVFPFIITLIQHSSRLHLHHWWHIPPPHSDTTNCMVWCMM